MTNSNILIEKLRQECLKRGASGIKGIGMLWFSIDDNHRRTITLEKFQKGILDHNINLTEDEVVQLFNLFDKNESGHIDYEEFLVNLRPPLSNFRMNLIFQAFDKLDKSKDGIITVEDLKGYYDVKNDPRYLEGDCSEEECLKEFLERFEISQHKDGMVTFDEFLSYYASVSASIDSNEYFDMMMRHSFKL